MKCVICDKEIDECCTVFYKSEDNNMHVDCYRKLLIVFVEKNKAEIQAKE